MLRIQRFQKLEKHVASQVFNLQRSLASVAKPNVSVDKIRNIGIIAHIDAGKTTVTERLLYLTGLTSVVGDVDDGNTVTDFMELERERGITIQSAAVTSFWRDHRINLIDTPGHVDFTLEVERCLRVLDGAVAVIDGSTGVQAQTLTVWRQAKKFMLPCVFFVNKLDKPGANFERAMDSIEQRLGQRATATVIPVCHDKSSKRVTGLVDLFSKKFLDLTDEKSLWKPIEAASKEFESLNRGREDLFTRIADTDDAFGTKLIEYSGDLANFDHTEALSSLRRAILSKSLAAVSCGTALRHTHSVTPILNHVVDLLPSPMERVYDLPDANFVGLVFKIVHDKRRGQLSYTRVYKGQLKSGSTVDNLNRESQETGLKLFTPFSDDFQASSVITEGNIAVLSGLKDTITGDTLTQGKITSSTLLSGIELPDPVFFCSVEPPSSSSIHAFDRALKELVIEDPSLKTRFDLETGQTIVEGMGELHIEVFKERLLREYGLNVFLGPLQVGYREVIDVPATESAFVEDQFGDQKFKQSCRISLRLEPTESASKFSKLLIDLEENANQKFVRSDWLKAATEGCKNALLNGPVLGFPVHNVKVTLKSLTASGGKVNPSLIAACANDCVSKALKASGAHLIEPIMLVEVTILDEAAKAGVNAVLQELTRRRGNIRNVQQQDTQGKSVIIEARVPLAETSGIAASIRSLSSGLGFLHMQLLEYEHVSPHDQAIIIERYYQGRKMVDY